MQVKFNQEMAKLAFNHIQTNATLALGDVLIINLDHREGRRGWTNPEFVDMVKPVLGPNLAVTLSRERFENPALLEEEYGYHSGGFEYFFILDPQSFGEEGYRKAFNAFCYKLVEVLSDEDDTMKETAEFLGITVEELEESLGL